MWSYLARFASFRDLAGYRREDLRGDAQAALTVALLGVPQSLAYALIAGLPPAMGLYAAALPAVFGALFRSSRFVITGPTNAVSLLIGTVVAAEVGAGDPVTIAVTLALIVGAIQLAMGLANLGALVDYISTAVVLGYITGAGLLIAVGQLPNVTGSPGGDGNLSEKLFTWAVQLGALDPRTLALALGTTAFILLLRRRAPKAPGPAIAIGIGIALATVFDLSALGITLTGDIAKIPRGLPPLSLPDLDLFRALLSAAGAIVVLSLVESNAVGRGIASKSGERLDTNAEFAGHGIANLAAAFTTGMPVSGSLARSQLNYDLGARTRISAALSGVFVLLVLLALGPVVDRTPVPSLAGLLLVIAFDLVDVPQIRSLLKSRWSDLSSFFVTLVGTMVLPLDEAIFLGVVISLVLFLRRARLLMVREMGVDAGLHLRDGITRDGSRRTCHAIRILHLEGSLFFGAANELRDALAEVVADQEARVVILRLKRTHDLDFTSASVFEEAHHTLEQQGRRLMLVGMREAQMDLITRTGIGVEIGLENLYPTRPGWFVAMNEAIVTALHHTEGHSCEPAGCPLERYAAARIHGATPSSVEERG